MAPTPVSFVGPVARGRRSRSKSEALTAALSGYWTATAQASVTIDHLEMIGPQRPDVAAIAKARAASKESVATTELAMASFGSSDEHTMLGRVLRAGKRTKHELIFPTVADRDSVPATPSGLVRWLALPMTKVRPPRLAVFADATLVGPPAPKLATAAKLAFVGPILPPVDGHDEHDDNALVVAAVDHEPHGLPFDPLAVGPFLPGPVQEARNNPFADFLAGKTEPDKALHTVAYTHELKHRIRPGETMSEVLGNLGLSSREVDEWIRAANTAYNVDLIFAGQELALVLEMPSPRLRGIRLEIDSHNILVAERGEKDVVSARREPIVYDRNLRVVGSEVQHSLYMSAQVEGIPDSVISDVAEILGWEINFERELDSGSTFRIVYEELTRVDTSETVPGRVLAVEVSNRGEQIEGFYFTMPDGSHAGYYNRDGEGLGRAFMRYPVAYSRISSQFTTKRFHPVLKRNVPHYGVDFAAPAGEPVKAVADGTILKAGWFGGNGRFVKIRHDSVYESGYAHLSRIASDVKAGTRIKKGQVIGYVGSTGLATGPHLHFAMYRSGEYIDPLKAKLPRSHSLDGKSLAAFRMTVDMMDRSYAQASEDESGKERIVTAAAQPLEQ